MTDCRFCPKAIVLPHSAQGREGWSIVVPVHTAVPLPHSAQGREGWSIVVSVHKAVARKTTVTINYDETNTHSGFFLLR